MDEVLNLLLQGRGVVFPLPCSNTDFMGRGDFGWYVTSQLSIWAVNFSRQKCLRVDWHFQDCIQSIYSLFGTQNCIPRPFLCGEPKP